jgi:hypothetical protein
MINQSDASFVKMFYVLFTYLQAQIEYLKSFYHSRQAPLKMASLGHIISDRKQKMITLTESLVPHLTGLAKTT